MAEGPPLDSYSPDTLERIVDGVLQLENSQRSLMELEDDIFGFCVKAFLPTEEGEVRLDVGEWDILSRRRYECILVMFLFIADAKVYIVGRLIGLMPFPRTNVEFGENTLQYGAIP